MNQFNNNGVETRLGRFMTISNLFSTHGTFLERETYNQGKHNVLKMCSSNPAITLRPLFIFLSALHTMHMFNQSWLCN